MFKKMLDVFGQLFSKSDERPKNKSEEPTTTDTQTGSSTVKTSLKVHRILGGPFSNSEDPLFDPEFELEYYWIDAVVEIDGVMMDTTIGHADFNEIYKIVKHLNSATVEPYEIGKNSD